MSFPYVEVNNSAVKLLQQGNYTAALPTFLMALNVFKQKVASVVAIKSDGFDSADYGYGQDSSLAARALRRKRAKLIQRDHRFFQSASFATPELLAKSSMDRLHMYSRAFLLSGKEADDPSSINRRDGTSSLILFNIGATLHAQAVRTGSTHTLEKALTAYRLALSSAEHWSLYSGGQGKGSLLEIAVVNNMALLHIQLMQVSDSLGCLRLLGRILLETYDLTREERTVFDWNIVMAMEGRFGQSPAPAA